MINKNIQKIFWEERSQETRNDTRYNIRFNRYIHDLYTKLSDIASAYLSRSTNGKKKKILKTDLRDAVIDTNRNMLRYLQKKFPYSVLYGLDISENLVQKAKSLYPNLIANGFDLRKWADENYRDFSFIGDYSTLDHIPQKELDKVFEFYSAALSADGIILIIYYRKSLFLNLLDKFYLKFKNKSFYEEAEENGQFYFDDEKINLILRRNNFIIVKEYFINILSLIPWIFWRYLPKFVFSFLVNLELSGGKIFKYNAGMRSLILMKKNGL